MKKFLINILSILIIFIIIIGSIFIYSNGSIKTNRYNTISRIITSDRLSEEKLVSNQFIKNYNFFKSFKNNNKSINLILGSSLVKDSVIPDSLNSKWFSFCNYSQNIYQSYKFLEHIKDSSNIDTIIIGVNPFDFPYSYIDDRSIDNLYPSLSPFFHLFGEDSITTIHDQYLLNFINFRSAFFPNINSFLNFLKKNKSIKNPRLDIWTKQGFSGRINKIPKDLDKEYKLDSRLKKWDINFFKNVQYPPELTYFNLFDSLAKSLNIEVFYILTPKSKYYFSNLNSRDKGEIWEKIVYKLNQMDINFLNFEKYNTDSLKFFYFFDEAHLSYNGAKHFTQILKEKIKKHNK